jgi:hypothetical protein
MDFCRDGHTRDEYKDDLELKDVKLGQGGLIGPVISGSSGT